jgi:hypothetical protein
MKYSPIVGWILLLAGIGIIGWTLINSYNIFTAKAVLPEFFEAPKEEAVTKKEGGQDIQVQMEKMIGEQLKGVLPVDSITKLLNLVVRSILAFILIFGGSQISGLGIKLIKK